MTGEQETLRLEGVSVARAGRLVVRAVDLEVHPASVTALLGPNGAGKSSLVLAVGGILGLATGSIRIGATVLDGRRPERVRTDGVAIVPEGRRLLPELTTHDNLRVATYALGKAEAQAGVESALELFPELRSLMDQAAGTLSGGQQQMVVLAQALVSKPRFILIDELSLGLAPVVVQRLIGTLEQVAASGVGILLVEQFTSVALELAERAYLLEGGQIRYEGTTEELRSRPELLHSAYLLRGSEDRHAGTV